MAELVVERGGHPAGAQAVPGVPLDLVPERPLLDSAACATTRRRWSATVRTRSTIGTASRRSWPIAAARSAAASRAILNYGHIERYNDRRGFFGFFECVDDQEVANGLFDAVREWFAEQGIY